MNPPAPAADAGAAVVRRPPVPDDVRALEAGFRRGGFALRIVGGWVRDLVHGGHAPKDLDLATDATPAEQARVYASMGLRHAETGLAHGTLTAITDGGSYEITTLRTESGHDGRHADVDWTRDWKADLGRRDLTINAMALGLEGGLLDPFGGSDDLRRGRVRFVGDPAQRIGEDALRILRWYRFQARFGSGAPDADAAAAVSAGAAGLGRLSVERIWSEVSRTIAAPGGLVAARSMEDLGTAAAIGLTPRSGWRLPGDGTGRDPVTVMAAWQGRGVAGIATRWRWSRAQTLKARYLASHLGAPCDPRRHLAVDGVPRDWAADLALLGGDEGLSRALETWDVPGRPLRGADLVAAGMTPGPQVAAALGRADAAWAASGYVLGRDDALGHAMAPSRTAAAARRSPPPSRRRGDGPGR